jgi:hypothetical protein
MSDNYAVINGKRVELTDEQVKALGIKRKNPFERVTKGNVYYKITGYGNVDNYREDGDSSDQALYDAVNYFNDDSFANQVALHQLLYRKLLKFAYDNECEDSEWNGENDHWLIFYDSDEKDFCIDSNDGFKMQGAVYFSNMDVAERAIKEVVEPFMKEHPDFVW